MNVLWIAHAVPYPPKAGFLLRSYNLLRALARRQTVDLVAFVQESWMTTLFASVEVGLAESDRALKEFCRQVTFLPIGSVTRHWGKQITALAAIMRGTAYTTTWLQSSRGRSVISQRVQATSYDVVHFDTIGLAPYRSLAKTLPATLTHHNIESHMMFRRAQSATNVLARAYFLHEARTLRAYEQRTADDFAVHITCSTLDSERLRELAPRATAVEIPNGVDCDFFQSQDLSERPDSLIFVGTMNWYPNIDAMLFLLRDIWPDLKRQLPAVTLDIAGSNPPKSITELAALLDGVAVHGYVPDVRPMLDAAALFVCPIRDGGGTKLKILDALAMKKCVIAHPVACEGIEVTADENVVLASTAREFVDQILKLLPDEQRRRRIGAAGRALVETQYSYRAIGERFNDVMEDAARRRPPQP
jgi:glycosyltransferase involved in cell wall biosynthesis